MRPSCGRQHCDLQVRHDLDLVDDRGVAAPVEHVFLDEFAIDSQPDAAALLVGLEMDVARIFVECFADQVRKKALSAADAAQVGRPPRYSANSPPGGSSGSAAGSFRPAQPARYCTRNPDSTSISCDTEASSRFPLPGAQHGTVLTGVRHEPVTPCLGGGKQLHDLGRYALGKGHGSER